MTVLMATRMVPVVTMPHEDSILTLAATRPSSTSSTLLSRATRRNRAMDSTPSRVAILLSSNINKATLSNRPTANTAMVRPRLKVHLHL